MEFRILGPLEAWEDGRVIPLPGGKPGALLAAMLTRPNEIIPSDELIDALWGERQPETAPKVLQTYVSQLRKALGRGGGDLVTRPGGYSLRVDPDRIDAVRFDRLVADGRRALAEERPDAAAALLAEALSLWRGAPLAEFRGEPFAAAEARRLDDARLAALEDRIEAGLRCGRDRELVPELERLVADHPLRERLRGQLMLALYRSGRQVDALRIYREGRVRLVDELGLEPGPELQRLEKAILVQDASLERAATPAPLRAAPPSTNGRPPGSVRPAMRPPRRSVVLVGALVVVVSALAGGLYAALGVGAGSTTVPPNSLAVIDPTTNQVTGAVAVGVRPAAVAVGEDGVWVVNVDDETLSRLDPATSNLVRTIPVGEYPSGLAVGLDAVWVASAPLGRLVRVDAATNAAGRAAPFGACGGREASVAVGADSVWVACQAVPGAFRVDPRTLSAVPFAYRAGLLTSASASVDPVFADVAFARGMLWLVDRARDRITQIDPATNQPVRQVTVGAAPVAVAATGDAIWVADRAANAVSRVALTALGRAPRVTTIPVGHGPVDIAATATAVWVANGGDDSISRIDPSTDRVVTTIRLGNPPAGIAVGAGRVWATVQAK